MSEGRRALFAGRHYVADPGRLRVVVESFIEDAVQVRLPGAPVGLVVPHGALMPLGGLVGAAYKQTLFFPAPARVVIVAPTEAQHGDALLCDPRPIYHTPLGDLPLDHALVQRLSDSGVPIALREDEEPVIETQALFILTAFGETPILPLRVPRAFQLNAELRLPNDTLVVAATNVGADAKVVEAIESVSPPQQRWFSRLLRPVATPSSDEAALRLGVAMMRGLGARRGRVLARAGEFLVGAAHA